MKKHTAKHLIVLCTCFCILLALGIFSASRVEAATVDYGFSVNGQQITSAHLSGKGYFYDSTSNTLTLNKDFSLSVTYSADKSVRSDWRGTVNRKYVPCIDLKELTKINIVIDGVVRISDSGSEYVYKDGDISYHTYGIYGADCNITFKSGSSGKGTLIVDTTDTAIYCHGMDADGIDMSLTSFGTSAIYSTSGVAFVNGTKATVTTESLGSIYQTWSSGSQSQNVSNGTFCFDSIAAIYAKSPSWQGNAILVMSGSTLDVYANITDVIDVRNDFRDESANTSMKDDYARVPYGDTWATTSSIDQRLYCGIWANESTVYVDQATLNVHTKSYTSRIRNSLDTYSRVYLWRTVGVNSFGVFACNADINVEMLGEDGILAVGDDVHAFYEVSYNTLYGDRIQDYDKGATDFDMYGVTNISSLIEQRYSEEATIHEKFAADSCMWYAFDWENTSKFREHGNYTGDNIIKPHALHWAGEVYSIRYEYTTLPESDLCLYRSIDSYYKDSTVYLRKNGTDYQYSKYYDFRDVTTLSGKLFDAEALGWDNDIEVISGDFEIKLSKDADMTLSVREGATAKLLLDGGIEKPYTGTYRINTAGNVTIDGDYYANEMYFDGLSCDTSDIEGVHGDIIKAGGNVTINSGTIASATPIYVNGIGFTVDLSINGGNINLINDRNNYYFDGHSAEKYTVDLGDYASIFDWHKLTHSSVLSTTGIYPIDGKLYYYKNPDSSGITLNANPITFHHFARYDESLGYDTYYFPQAAAEGGYTVYRLQEHDIYQKAGNAKHYINDGKKNYTFDSFVYYKAYYMPGNNPFLLDEDNLTLTEIAGTRSRTAPDSATVVWGRYDSTGAFSQLNESGGKALSLTMDISYSMNDYSGYFCTVTDAEGNEHTLNYEINVIRFGTPNDQYVGSGETASFSCSYEAVGDWTNGFTWRWEYRVNDSARWQTLSGSSGNSCTFTAFYNSADSNSHGYQFRLVGTMSYIAAIGSGETSTVYTLCSEPATLYMGAKVVESPATAKVQINDPNDTFIITVKYQRAREAVLQKLVGETYQDVEGVTMTTSTGADGVVTLNLIFAKSHYSDADGNWDSAKFDGTYRLWLKGRQVEGKTEYYNDAYAEIRASVAPAPAFTGTKDSLVAVPGENIYYTVGFENLDDSDPVWWEYSLDGGKTWIKLTETDDTKPLYIFVFRGITITSTAGTSQRFGANSTVYFNPVTLVQDGMLVRCVMQDECGIYYSDSAASTKLTVIGFPSFDKQPQSTVLNETKQTTAEIYYTLSGEISSDVTVTCQWQKYVSGMWTNITTNDLYDCSDQKLTFKDISALDNKAQYRCKLSLSKNGVTRDITTDAATVCVAHLPEFTDGPTANATEYWAGDEFKLSTSWDALKSSASWQVCKDGTNWIEYVSPAVHPVDSWNTGATDSWFKINSLTAEMDGWQFRMSVEYSAGTLELGYETCTAYSDVYTLHVYSGNCDIESDIQKAVDKGYTTIKLVDNITLSKTWVIDKDMILDLNGHILQGDGTEYNLIRVTNNATLTIIDSDPNADASYGGTAVPFKGGSIRNSGDTALRIETGTVLFNAGTVYQCKAAESSPAAAFIVYSSDDYESRLVIDGGQIIDCGSKDESAIMVAATIKKGAYAIFKSGRIDSCKGCAISTIGGIIEMSGGTISNCSGAIASMFAERVTVTGGLIENCHVSNNGGTIAGTFDVIEISNVTINGCTASGTDGKNGKGGAIYISIANSCTLGDGIVIKNCQANSGGAIYVEKLEFWPTLDVIVKDIQISGCSAADDVIMHVSGAIYADGGKIEGNVVANGGIKKTDPTHADTTEFYGNVTNGGADNEPITAGMYYAGVTGISEADTVVTVTFKNGGETHAVLVMQKGTVAVPAETPKDFRTFIGWYNGDMLYLFDKAVNEDIVLEARWAMDASSVDDLTEYLEQLEEELRDAIEGKADADEIQKAIDDLKAAIEELKAAKDDYKDADKALEDKLLDAIEKAQDAAIKAAQKLVEEAQKELQDAIDQKADADTVNAELEKLKKAIAILESAKDNYKDADKELEAKLTAAIEAAQKAAVEAAQKLVEDATKALQDAIYQKADADTVNAELEKLKNAIAALEAVKDDYKAADKQLEDKLDKAIDKAKDSAVDAAKKLVEDATKELQDAIANGDKSLEEQIKKMNQTLETVRSTLEYTSETDKQELQNKIKEAESALIAAIEELDDRLTAAEDRLDRIEAEMQEKHNSLILIIVIAIVAFAAVDIAIIAAWLTWKRKKNL